MEPTVPQKKLEPGVYQGTPKTTEQLINNEPSAPRIVRTMKSDAAEAIKKQNETAVSIAIAEEKKREVERAKQAQSKTTVLAPKPIGRLVVVMMVVLIGAALGLAYVFVLPKLDAIKLPKISIPSFGKPADTTAVTIKKTTVPLAPSLVPAQSEKRIAIANKTRAQILGDIATEKNGGTIPSSIKNLHLTEDGGDASTAISANRFFIFAEVSAPEILTRSLEKPFMMGFLGEQNGNSTPFIILKVSSHETGLAGMLEWEATLPSSFDSIFGTKTESSAKSATKFRDIIVLGKDARALDTAVGATVAYAFSNQNTVVIAGSRSALEALLSLASKI